MNKRIALLIEPNEKTREKFAALLRDTDLAVSMCATLPLAYNMLSTEEIGFLVCSNDIEHEDTATFVKILRAEGHPFPILMYTTGEIDPNEKLKLAEFRVPYLSRKDAEKVLTKIKRKWQRSFS